MEGPELVVNDVDHALDGQDDPAEVRLQALAQQLLGEAQGGLHFG